MMVDYFFKMKNYANEMVAPRQPLSDEDFSVYVLTGLDEEFYNPLVSYIATRVEPIALWELYSQMLSYEIRVNKQSGGGYGSNSLPMLPLALCTSAWWSRLWTGSRPWLWS
jgi:hypothetical protein